MTDDEKPETTPKHRYNRHLSGALIGVLILVLGFAIVTQVRTTSSNDNLSGLRENDLISILDNQNARADRLRQQLSQLQQTLRQLRSSGDQSAAARKQARQEAAALGVLVGTLPATGPGVVVTVTDPEQALSGEKLLDVVEELRGAGAEAIQFGPVRVSTTTSVTGAAGSVEVDGVAVGAPYRILAIGDATTLDTALNIPGGIAATVRADGGQLTVTEQDHMRIRVTRALPSFRYAQPG